MVEISRRRGIEFRFDTDFEALAKTEDGTLRATLGDGGALDADVVVFATGRLPNTDGLGLVEVGVALAAGGAVEVDADNRSSVDSVYAVGDVTARVQLTPVAVREGQAFADTAF